jgi:hypothetical protein
MKYFYLLLLVSSFFGCTTNGSKDVILSSRNPSMDQRIIDNECAVETLKQAQLYINNINDLYKYDGKFMNLTLYPNSLLEVQKNKFSIVAKASLGPNTYFARQIFLTGQASYWSCEVSQFEVFELKLIAPDSTVLGNLIYKSDTGI